MEDYDELLGHILAGAGRDDCRAGHVMSDKQPVDPAYMAAKLGSDALLRALLTYYANRRREVRR